MQFSDLGSTTWYNLVVGDTKIKWNFILTCYEGKFLDAGTGQRETPVFQQPFTKRCWADILLVAA